MRAAAGGVASGQGLTRQRVRCSKKLPRRSSASTLLKRGGHQPAIAAPPTATTRRATSATPLELQLGHSMTPLQRTDLANQERAAPQCEDSRERLSSRFQRWVMIRVPGCGAMFNFARLVGVAGSSLNTR
jgi:hypothetical protein